jgi:hypothetical protein
MAAPCGREVVEVDGIVDRQVPRLLRFRFLRQDTSSVRVFAVREDAEVELYPLTDGSPFGFQVGAVHWGTDAPATATLNTSRAVLAELFRYEPQPDLRVSSHARQFAETYLVPMDLAPGEEATLDAGVLHDWVFQELAR